MQEDRANSAIDLHLELDASHGRRAGLEHALRMAIQTGQLTARTRLPATRALAARLGLARNTVSAAYDQLIAEGYLLARQGASTEVAGLPADPARRPSLENAGQAVEAVLVPSHDLRPGCATAPRHDLRPGNPDVSRFPVDAWLRASRRSGR
jgi:GntR family transcriptional regulator/MocR family aminotransferase